MTETAPRTRAHNHRELAAVLDWTETDVDKALTLGILPEHDLKTPRWKGATVDSLAARLAELDAAFDREALLTEGEARTTVGLERGTWYRGREHGIIPGPDRGAFWTREAADALKARAAELRDQVPPPPLGAARCAALLAEQTGLPVEYEDVVTLNAMGHADVVDYYKDFALYDTAALERLAAGDTGKETIASVVAERVAWTESSVTTEDAAGWLDWTETDVERVAAEQGITPGRDDRWAREDIARLSADEDLVDRVRRARLLGPELAARHMEIRRTDFDYVVAAGWVTPARYETRDLLDGFKDIRVPLYTVGSLEDALATPGVDWEEVRAVKPGKPSPLREHTRRPAQRAEVVRAFCARFGEQHGVEVWPHFANRDDQWHIDWEQRAVGAPTKAQAAEALAAHPGASKHAEHIVLSTAVGDVIRTARAALEPGRAVVLDTETVDLGGVIIELSVVDACTGEILMDTLVSPDGEPVADGARAVHGISDEELADAPRWEDVLPQFLEVTRGKKICAYNAFTSQVICRKRLCRARFVVAALSL